MGRSIYPAPGTAKPEQRGTLSVSANATGTATIAAVNMAKSKLRYLGANGTTTVNIALTNPTTITFNNLGSGAGANVSWELTELY